MRRFVDSKGSVWDVVIGRESWGTLLALFVPGDSSLPVRQAPLRASDYDAAAQELVRMDDAALQALLDGAAIKDEG
jgi:hypothetical protein